MLQTSQNSWIFGIRNKGRRAVWSGASGEAQVPSTCTRGLLKSVFVCVCVVVECSPHYHPPHWSTTARSRTRWNHQLFHHSQGTNMDDAGHEFKHIKTKKRAKITYLTNTKEQWQGIATTETLSLWKLRDAGQTPQHLSPSPLYYCRALFWDKQRWGNASSSRIFFFVRVCRGDKEIVDGVCCPRSCRLLTKKKKCH